MRSPRFVARIVLLICTVSLATAGAGAALAQGDPVRLDNTYFDWLLDRAFLLVPAQAYVGQFLGTFKEYPPRQKAASFSLDQVMEKLLTPGEH